MYTTRSQDSIDLKDIENLIKEGNTFWDIVHKNFGGILKKLFRLKALPSFWINNFAMTSVVFLIWYLMSLLFKRGPRLDLESAVVSSLFILILMNGTSLISNLYRSFLLRNFLPAMNVPTTASKNISELRDWIQTKVYNLRGTLLIPFILTLILNIVAWAFYNISALDLFTIILIYNFLIAQGIYYLFVIVNFVFRLRSVRLHLYSDDPVSSEIVFHLSRGLNGLGFVVGFLEALNIYYNYLIGTLDIISGVLTVLFGLVPLFIIYLGGYLIISQMVTAAKWDTLNEIQTKIVSIKENQDISEKETMDAVNRLMDYHDRIKEKRSSVFNFRASLSFFNSLLLPVLGFVLGNYEMVLELLGITN